MKLFIHIENVKVYRSNGRYKSLTASEKKVPGSKCKDIW